MLSLTLSDMDTFNFLSAVVKGSEVDLPYLFWKTIGYALLPDTDLEGQEERGTAEHENIESTDITQLFRFVGAIDEVYPVGGLSQNTLYFIIAGVASISQAHREGG